MRCRFSVEIESVPTNMLGRRATIDVNSFVVFVFSLVIRVFAVYGLPVLPWVVFLCFDVGVVIFLRSTFVFVGGRDVLVVVVLHDTWVSPGCCS